MIKALLYLVCSPCAECPEETDEVWRIEWPRTPPNTIATASCGPDTTGMDGTAHLHNLVHTALDRME